MKSMASRADGHGRGHDGGAQREICGAQRSVGHGRQRDGVRSGMAMRAAVG